MSAEGVVLAVLSGALTSGVGYVLWYVALRRLTATRAAVVQLAVPVLAAIGGAIVLAEEISTRVMLSALLILGGVGLALRGRGGRRHGERSSVRAVVRSRLVAGGGVSRD